MTRQSKLPDALEGLPFALSSAVDLGVPRSRTRASDLSTPSRGVRQVRAGADDFADVCRPYVSVTDGGFISHVSAARLHSMPLPYLLQNDPMVHLSRPPGRAAPRRRGIAGHRMAVPPEDTTVLRGVRVTSAARTWIDLATVLSPLDLIVAGDFLVSCHQRSYGEWTEPVATLEALGDFLSIQRNVPGLVWARRAYGRLRVGVDSPPETKVRIILEDAGLPRFTVDCPILLPDGDVAQWVDLANEEFRVMIEYDGAHHLTPEQQFRDMQRDARTVELGWTQIKINQLDLRHGPKWIEGKVRRVLERRGYGRP